VDTTTKTTDLPLEELHAVVARTWGIHRLRPLQLEAIEANLPG